MTTDSLLRKVKSWWPFVLKRHHWKLIADLRSKLAEERKRADYFTERFREAADVIRWPKLVGFEASDQVLVCESIRIVSVEIRPLMISMRLPIKTCTVTDAQRAASAIEECAWMGIEDKLRGQLRSACLDAARLLRVPQGT
jgi:hypothetical protein